MIPRFGVSFAHNTKLMHVCKTKHMERGEGEQWQNVCTSHSSNVEQNVI